ncbi:hypothetical protein [Anaplasma capra]|uniref:hypothetical protein n=1 Tax=Anaplasma capra TaxID=1562740 RepID=UPI0021D57464|nr:hypothetical protein [Anaplasma capra]MCU7611687.1 hypothetical protein [Anaplasma capra]MCU7612163.1 hypothetical protein [Anaplasma capra]
MERVSKENIAPQPSDQEEKKGQASIGDTSPGEVKGWPSRNGIGAVSYVERAALFRDIDTLMLVFLTSATFCVLVYGFVSTARAASGGMIFLEIMLSALLAFVLVALPLKALTDPSCFDFNGEDYRVHFQYDEDRCAITNSKTDSVSCGSVLLCALCFSALTYAILYAAVGHAVYCLIAATAVFLLSSLPPLLMLVTNHRGTENAGAQVYEVSIAVDTTPKDEEIDPLSGTEPVPDTLVSESKAMPAAEEYGHMEVV